MTQRKRKALQDPQKFKDVKGSQDQKMVREKIVSDNKNGGSDFTGGPEVRAPSSQQRGHRFHPYSRNQGLRSHAAWLEKKKKCKNRRERKEGRRKKGKKKESREM